VYKIVIPPKDIIDLFIQDRELRIEYVSVETECKHIIPILYYMHNQKSASGSVMTTMVKSVIEGLDRNLISQKIDELKSMGFNVLSMSLCDNLHTHPIGVMGFSHTDEDGLLKPDYGDGIGSNMLFGFNGEFYNAKRRKVVSGKYTYDIATPVKLSAFKPIINVTQDDIKTKNKETHYGYKRFSKNKARRKIYKSERMFRYGYK